MARFTVAGMTRRLPFPSGGFDAVMSDVAMHLFLTVGPGRSWQAPGSPAARPGLLRDTFAEMYVAPG
jgi:hypothetical protein